MDAVKSSSETEDSMNKIKSKAAYLFMQWLDYCRRTEVERIKVVDLSKWSDKRRKYKANETASKKISEEI